LQEINDFSMQTIAIFASGSGTNAQQIIEYFRNHPSITIGLVLCNKPGAAVIGRAERLGVPVVLFNRQEFYETDAIPALLAARRIDYIVLAGFLWLIPPDLLGRYAGKIVNIHPALLPKYGGQGMYGMKVHEAVILAGDAESGITIHVVNEHYDEGKILFQATCPVLPDDTPDTLAARIHELEYRHFAEVVERLVTGDG
jgi:phosphoribosylglycinamide formyltransferase 1